MRINYKILLTSLIVLLTLACKRKKDEVPTPLTSPSPIGYSATYPIGVATNYTIASDFFSVLVRIVDESFTTGYYSSCSVITVDSISSLDADTVTIDFGTVNCLDFTGRSRRGAIACVYNGGYNDSLSTKQITFNNYFVNDKQLTGTLNVTNNGRDASGRIVYSVVTSGSILLASGTTVYNASNLFTRASGASTSTFSDDVWMISGLGTGTSDSGLNYTFSITSPIIRANACTWMTQGTVNFVPSGYISTVLDFGIGACDNQANITIEGNVFVLSLP